MTCHTQMLWSLFNKTESNILQNRCQSSVKPMYGFEVTLTCGNSSTWTRSNINISFNEKKFIISSKLTYPVEENILIWTRWGTPIEKRQRFSFVPFRGYGIPPGISAFTKGRISLSFYTCTEDIEGSLSLTLSLATTRSEWILLDYFKISVEWRRKLDRDGGAGVWVGGGVGVRNAYLAWTCFESLLYPVTGPDLNS